MTMLSEGCMGAGGNFQAPCQAPSSADSQALSIRWVPNGRLPEDPAAPPWCNLGQSAQQGCSANPQRSNVHRGCFPLAAESRLYICALVFAGCSAGAPTQLGRTRRALEQGVAVWWI